MALVLVNIDGLKARSQRDMLCLVVFIIIDLSHRYCVWLPIVTAFLLVITFYDGNKVFFHYC